MFNLGCQLVCGGKFEGCDKVGSHAISSPSLELVVGEYCKKDSGLHSCALASSVDFDVVSMNEMSIIRVILVSMA
jgi:hypothetical protein